MSSCPETAREINRIQLALLHETDRDRRQMLRLTNYFALSSSYHAYAGKSRF